MPTAEAASSGAPARVPMVNISSLTASATSATALNAAQRPVHARRRRSPVSLRSRQVTPALSAKLACAETAKPIPLASTSPDAQPDQPGQHQQLAQGARCGHRGETRGPEMPDTPEEISRPRRRHFKRQDSESLVQLGGRAGLVPAGNLLLPANHPSAP